MDIRARLEAEHSKALTLAIVKYVGSDKKRFKELLDIFFGGEYRMTQRAAWPLSYVCIAHPALINPYFAKFMDRLKDPAQHPAIRRNIFRIFQEIDVPQKYQGALIDECFKNITDPSQPIAVLAFAITTATRLCVPFPELRRELLLVLNQLTTHPQTPAIKVRIKRALKELT